MKKEILSKSYKIWMIHEVTEKDGEILSKLSPKENLFVWDDAVISQYKVIKKLLNFKNILGVSTNIANAASFQEEIPILYEKTHLSHERWHINHDARAFMTWNMIRELKEHGVYIAAHGYNHTHINHDIKIGFKELMEDCEKILTDFRENLSWKPEIYVYPYNDTSSWSEIVLRKYGMLGVGPNRLDYNKIFKEKKI